jgi:hypothetical protein
MLALRRLIWIGFVSIVVLAFVIGGRQVSDD